MRNRAGEVLIKKYSNRRLYDTTESKYITLDELTAIIRSGRDVRIVDAKTNEDLTQATLAQMILESGRAARLLPQPLLIQLVRMSDDALAEFFGRYLTWALDIYNQAKSGAAALAPFNPFATLPFAATNALAKFWTSAPMWSDAQGGPPPWAGMPGAPPWPGAPGAPPPGAPPAGAAWPGSPSAGGPPQAAYAAPPGAYAAPPPDDEEPEDDELPPDAPPLNPPHAAPASPSAAPAPAAPGPAAAAASPPSDELAELKRQFEELKRALLKAP